MKFTLKVVSLIFAALLLTACGDPKLDGSSNEAMKKSVQEIMTKLPDEKKEEFKKTLTGIYMLGALASMGSDKSKEEVQAEITAKLDGKTADDVFAMAKEIKEKMNKNKEEN